MEEQGENANSAGNASSVVKHTVPEGVMAKIDYERYLEEAGDDVEREAEENITEALIAERLNTLKTEGFELGEAEQLAAQADEPLKTNTGKVLGLMDRSKRPLTKSQQAFAQGIIEGKSRKQAFKDAYPDSKAADTTIQAAAAKLIKDDRIRRMIESGWEETTEALSEDQQAVRRYVLRALVAMSKGAKAESSKIKALELLGRTTNLFKDTAEREKPITAEQLRRELASHLRLVSPRKAGGT